MKEIIWHEGELFNYPEVVEVPDPDTSLHAMAGPWQPTPQWIIDGWQRAADARIAREQSGSDPSQDQS